MSLPVAAPSNSPSHVRTTRASDAAYQRLRDMIVDLRLPPGMPVDEQSLAAEVGLGRMPVREAVARLAGDHLVVIMPRRGIIISPIGLDSVREIFEAREAIECGTAYWASRHATIEELVVLRRLIEEADDAREETDFARFLDDDQRVHRSLAHAAHNTFLAQAADRLLVHNLRFWRFFAASHPITMGAMMTHRPLLAALERRDADAAHAAMRAHPRRARPAQCPVLTRREQHHVPLSPALRATDRTLARSASSPFDSCVWSPN